ncbi:MAG: DNA alkylation repair protein [Hyphomicrobiales bacterium]|nr:DNA alkylation repair protein [Hyphomicrobiales bacterium]MCP4997208.1 DNA alkylation repair protein [Hyphomicrobiales bacterium]
MAEPFKNVFNPDLIAAMGRHFAMQSPDFDADRFAALATGGLEALEFKQRSNQIVDALEACLPNDFRSASGILTGALHPEDDVDLSDQTVDEHGIRGWGIIPMSDYVARAGLDDFDFSMDVLKEMTKRSSAEFAVRPFLKADPDRAMRHVLKWSRDSNFHVRRLASEGIRPRLPWGMRLGMFVDDPSPVLPVLENLRDDPEEFVRRSVANNLNDIAKDHPDIVSGIARNWLAGDPGRNRGRLVRHACRTLIKSGHRPTLEALGYGPPAVTLEALDLDRDTVQFGDAIRFSADIRSASDDAQELVVDYVVHHQKANGTTTPKVFKWTTMRLAGGENKRLEKKHAFRPITTRVYYGGQHIIEIQANGQSLGQRAFTLVM